MKATASQKLKTGVFTLVGILILLGGIFAIGSKRNLFNSTFIIYGTFKNIGGLQIGNNVRFAGINVGNVEGINIDNDSTVRITMRLKTGIHKFLKTDATATIGSDGLMGDKLVNISPGVDGRQLIAKGGTIITVNPVDYNVIISKFTRVVDNAEIITTSLASISSHISEGRGSLGKLIYSDSLEKGLASTVNEAKKTMQTAKAGVASFNENMTAVKHNFLLKGYFKKKRVKDSLAKKAGDSEIQPGESKKQRRKEERDEKKAQKQEGQ